MGESNALRLHIKDPDVVNLSKSGQTAAEIDSLLEHAREKAGKKVVKRIVMHLGTNVSRCRTDSNQVTLEVSSAVNKVHTTFPKANIAFSSILQRKGKPPSIGNMNKTGNIVNQYMKKMSTKEYQLNLCTIQMTLQAFILV